ncbi:MAG: hypothetical protein ACXVSL_22705, partial [Solirubrobacteraceae bacterium]
MSGGRGGFGMGAVRERDRRGGVGVDAGDRCGALGVLVLVMAVGDLLEAGAAPSPRRATASLRYHLALAKP